MIDRLVGGVGLTYLHVYDARPGPDGIDAGCAQVHGLTDEAYFGVSGKGAIELHDLEHGYRRIPITTGVYVQFPPWTLHRSVSVDGLEVLALMGNQGLAERGDARIYFGEEADRDPDRHERLKRLAQNGVDGALERRDHSSRAYMDLMRLWDNDKDAYRSCLSEFFDCHRRAIANDADLSNHVDTVTHVSGVDYWSKSQSGDRLGMCGLLRQVVDLQQR